LHFADIRKLLQVLGRLRDGGNTVLVIEHNLDVIKTADHIIDLGPEGGDGGGMVVAQGTPEEIVSSGSYTGEFLKEVLNEAQESFNQGINQKKELSEPSTQKNGK
jgi:excinuclease ABC subunit A